MAAAPDVTRDEYAHVATIPTRWADNDIYGHVNNVEYYAFFDTAINGWLIKQGGLDIHHDDVIGVCAESRCAYHAAIAFPEVVEAALRVGERRQVVVGEALLVFYSTIATGRPNADLKLHALMLLCAALAALTPLAANCADPIASVAIFAAVIAPSANW